MKIFKDFFYKRKIKKAFDRLNHYYGNKIVMTRPILGPKTYGFYVLYARSKDQSVSVNLFHAMENQLCMMLNTKDISIAIEYPQE